MKNKNNARPVKGYGAERERPTHRASDKVQRKNGTILEALPSTHFKVQLEDGKEIIAHLAGRLRIHKIKVLPGDKVTIEMSEYDDNRGRIVYRGK